jgi:hypothetical protein
LPEDLGVDVEKLKAFAKAKHGIEDISKLSPDELLILSSQYKQEKVKQQNQKNQEKQEKDAENAEESLNSLQSSSCFFTGACIQQ